MSSLTLAREVIQIEAQGILALLDQIDASFDLAIEFIMACPGRVILTGIGKSGIIGQKIAATLNSTGTASLFLHPVEAMHGDLGIVEARDVIIALSYSGETQELNTLLVNIKHRGPKIIAITGNAHSRLAALADAVLLARVPREACPLGLAPTASTTATLAIGDALAVVLLDRKGFKDSDFRRNHPAGSLGERLNVNVTAVMLTGAQIPRVCPEATVSEAMTVLNRENLGAVLVIDDDEQLAGILTDGDIRRMVIRGDALRQRKIAEVMTKKPFVIGEEFLAADALSIMQRHEVTLLAVLGRDGRIAGVVHLHDLLGKGEFRFLV